MNVHLLCVALGVASMGGCRKLTFLDGKLEFLDVLLHVVSYILQSSIPRKCV